VEPIQSREHRHRPRPPEPWTPPSTTSSRAVNTTIDHVLLHQGILMLLGQITAELCFFILIFLNLLENVWWEDSRPFLVHTKTRKNGHSYINCSPTDAPWRLSREAQRPGQRPQPPPPTPTPKSFCKTPNVLGFLNVRPMAPRSTRERFYHTWFFRLLFYCHHGGLERWRTKRTQKKRERSKLNEVIFSFLYRCHRLTLLSPWGSALVSFVNEPLRCILQPLAIWPSAGSPQPFERSHVEICQTAMRQSNKICPVSCSRRLTELLPGWREWRRAVFI